MKKIIGHVEYEMLETGGMGTVFKALEKGVNGFEKIVAIHENDILKTVRISKKTLEESSGLESKVESDKLAKTRLRFITQNLSKRDYLCVISCMRICWCFLLVF